MKCLNFLKEPFEPTAVEPSIRKLLETAALVDARVESELGALYYTEDDCVLESYQDVPNPVEAERILASVHEVLLHDGQGVLGWVRVCKGYNELTLGRPIIGRAGQA